jgi:hypothetical protein
LRNSSQFGARDGGFPARERENGTLRAHWIVVHGNLLTTCLKSKGLDLPIAGVPTARFDRRKCPSCRHFGRRLRGMRPSMLVQEGDRVIKGQALFEDKKIPA